MTTITIKKFICTKNATNNKNIPIQTIGKIYDVTIEKDTYEGVIVDHETLSFIGDDGISYLISHLDKEFIELDKWREQQLNIILN